MNFETRYNKDWMPFAYPLGFVRMILLVDWDPIRILGHPGAMDEYDTYATKVCNILEADGRAAEVAAYLERVQSERMEQDVDRTKTSLLAEKICRVYRAARSSTGE